MSRVHGSVSMFNVNGTELATFVDQSTWQRDPDIHNITGGGATDHVFIGGLGKGQSTLQGGYDNTVGTSPRNVLEPLEGDTVILIDRPEGVGSGKPQRSVSVVVGAYQETRPVADMVKWTQTLQHSGPVTRTIQP